MRHRKIFNYFAMIFAFIIIFFSPNWNLASGQSFKPRVIIGDLVLTSYDIKQKKKMMSLFHGRNFSETDVVELFLRCVNLAGLGIFLLFYYYYLVFLMMMYRYYYYYYCVVHRFYLYWWYYYYLIYYLDAFY